ncbi:hypothetical protein EON63_01290 [archaeon]|nr:MAG: hypothetical protein EON63_01290 [archaeon]
MWGWTYVCMCMVYVYISMVSNVSSKNLKGLLLVVDGVSKTAFGPKVDFFIVTFFFFNDKFRPLSMSYE